MTDSNNVPPLDTQSDAPTTAPVVDIFQGEARRRRWRNRLFMWRHATISRLVRVPRFLGSLLADIVALGRPTLAIVAGGDLGHPTRVMLYDYDSGEQLTSVRALRVRVCVDEMTTGVLYFVGGGYRRVEVLPVPPGVKIGSGVSKQDEPATKG